MFGNRPCQSVAPLPARPTPRSGPLRLASLAAALVVPWAAGCASGPEPVLRGAPSPGQQVTVQADWADVPAALDLALSAIEAAPLRVSDDDAGRYRVELVTILDRAGWLEATRTAPPPGPVAASRPEPVTLRARVGRDGDGVLESRLLEAAAARLTALAGKDAAPIDGPFGLSR